MAYQSDDSFFSEETCKLCEIPDRVELPTLVRVTEGIYTTHDCSSFSQGDIIKIDGCETIDMVAAHLAVWTNGRYREYGDEIYVPICYKGRVRVCPIHGSGYTYNSVEELISFFPKFVKVGQRLSFTYKGESNLLHSGDTLELLNLIGSQTTGVLALRVRHNNKSEMCLPKSLKGPFITQEVDIDYTVSDVIKLKMPQCVKFIGQDISLFTSKDIQEAAANIQHYDGYILLSHRKKTRTVLLGHYKSMTNDPSTRFCRRSAVVLPMDNPDIANIEVQVPMYMDTEDYEIFLLNHFSECDISQPVEGLLYIDFSKNPGIIFPQDSKDKPPVVPPRTDKTHGSTCVTRSTCGTPPPRPPRTDKATKQQTTTREAGPTVRRVIPAYENHAGKIKSKSKQKSESSSRLSDGSDGGKEGNKPAHSSKPIGHVKHAAAHCQHEVARKQTNVVAPVQQEEDVIDGAQFVIGDIFGNSGDGADKLDESVKPDSEMAYMNSEDEKTTYQQKAKRIMHKIKKTFSSLGTEKDHDIRSETSPSDDIDPTHVYDYVDENTLREVRQNAETPDTKQKTAIVQPFHHQRSKSPVNRLKSLSVNELHACFERCALESLAQIVRINKLDGEMFSALSDLDLTKDPFYLNNLDIKKVRKIQSGWTPNV